MGATTARGPQYNAACSRPAAGFACSWTPTTPSPSTTSSSCWPCFADGYAVVIGARGPDDGNTLSRWHAWYRRVAGRAGNFVIQTLVVPGVDDTQTGFKMFTGACAAAVFPRLTIARWGFDVEVLAIAHRMRYATTTVPVTVHNQPDSKVKLLTYFQVLREVWQVRRNLRAGRYD